MREVPLERGDMNTLLIKKAHPLAYAYDRCMVVIGRGALFYEGRPRRVGERSCWGCFGKDGAQKMSARRPGTKPGTESA